MSDDKKKPKKPTNKKSTAKKPTKKKDGQTRKAKYYTTGGARKTLSTNAKTTARQMARISYLVRKAGYAKKRKKDARSNRKLLSLNNLLKGKRCFPSTQVYGGTSQGNKGWLCSSLNQITFREKNYDIRECEFRVFVEGSEVTAYVRGSVQWSIQTTEGMNTCTFSLNNNHDAFILTPANVCSKTDLHGWRVPLDMQKRLITNPGRPGRNIDETAKYVIYKNKYERVRPGKPDQQISDDGIWLYPLNPFSCIFHKHDCVRVFYRLPHVTSACKMNTETAKCRKKGNGAEYEEVWAPAFTGFIDEYDFEDDPVGGDRVVNIRCYDWRGLFNRMRVRMQINPSPGSAKKKELANPVFNEVSTAAKKAREGKKGKKDSYSTDTNFLNVIHDLRISADLILLFNTKFSAEMQLHCPGKAVQSPCAKNIYKNVRESVADKVDQLSVLYNGGWFDKKTGKKAPGRRVVQKAKQGGRKGAKVDYVKVNGLKPAMAGLMQDEGIKATLTRDKNQNVVTVTYSAFGAKAATKAIGKATKFLQTTGKAAAKYAKDYYDTAPIAAYNLTVTASGRNAARRAQASALIDLNKPSARKEGFSVINPLPEMQAIDKAMEEDKNNPDLYAKAGLARYASTNRVYLLNQYVTKTVLEMFSGVSDVIKKDIDTRVKKKTTRTLFTIAKGATIVSFVNSGAATAVALALQGYMTGKQADQGRAAKAYIDTTLAAFNTAYKQIIASLLVTEAQEKALLANNPNVRTQAQTDALRRIYTAAGNKAKKNKVKSSEKASRMQDLTQTTARFNQVAAGMYQDLIRATEVPAHPLAKLSFEMAVEWLTLTHTSLQKGFEDKLTKYDRGELQKWNLNMLFGVMGRPLTYREVTAMGKGTVSNDNSVEAPYSPLNAFVHMMLPAKGTGAETMVQQDITKNPFGGDTLEWATRLALLNQICKTLDYQFYVTPLGDLAFEFPNYNALPYDYGRVFQGAYTIVKGLRSFKVASEQGDLNTAWVIEGSESDVFLENATAENIKKNLFKKIVISADVLVRRIGVRVRNLKIEIPGVGAAFSKQNTRDSLIAYGLLEIQRELGRMETATVQHEFRPFMLPNRPIHIVHRQRMALARNVSYSMTPLGDCSTSVDLHYVRGLDQDGAFRHMSGGTRMPVDYSGLYTGDVAQTVRAGAPPTDASKARSLALATAVMDTSGQGKPKNLTNWSCGPYMRDRWLTAGASYTDQMNTAFKSADKYTKWTMGGSKGGYAPLTLPDGSYIAKGSYRVTGTAGNPAAVASLPGSGLSNATEGGNKSDKQSTASKDGYFGNLYDPWAYGQQKNDKYHQFHQFGFIRYIERSGNLWRGAAGQKKYGKRNHRGVVGSWHSGVDFYGNGIHGKEAYTPIPIYKAYLFMGVGYTGYNPAKYTWSRPYSNGEKAPTDKRDILFLVRGKTLKNKPKKLNRKVRREGAREVVYFRLDGTMLSLYDKMKKKYKMEPRVSRRYGANTGLTLELYGYASMPGARESKLQCKLSYVHCSDLMKNPATGHWIGKRYLPSGERAIAAKTAVIKVGSTGTATPHLHFGMMVYRPGATDKDLGGAVASGDAAAYKEVLKANKEFLRAQMKMKLTGGTANINSGVLSESWREYFKSMNSRHAKWKGKTNVTTVDQAVDYMLSKSAKYWASTDPGRSGIRINPLFFFRPEQIIKGYEDKYKKYRSDRPESYFGAGAKAGVCGPASAPMKQKIALEYSICLGKVRGIPKNRRKSGRIVCKATRKERLKGTKLTARKSSKAHQTERVHRKLDAKTKRSTRAGSNAPGRQPGTG